MQYKEVKDLPKQIQERYFAAQYESFFIDLQKSQGFGDGHMHTLYILRNEFFFGTKNLTDFPELVEQQLQVSSDQAKKIALEFYGKYFLTFQDFFGNVEQYIIAMGGDLHAYQEYAREVLSPHIQLHDRVMPFFASAGIEEPSDAMIAVMIDYLLAAPSADDEMFQKKVLELLHNAGKTGECAEAFAELEFEPLALLFRRDVKDYYRNLADTVLTPTTATKTSSKNKASEPEEEKDSYTFRERFEKLADIVKQSLLSSVSAQQKIEGIEKKYNVTVEDTILRAAVGEIPLSDLAIVLHKEQKISPEIASQVRDEIIESLFKPVLSYFISNKEAKGNDGVTVIQQMVDYEKEARNIISSSGIQVSPDALNRLQQLVVTRLRNVRNSVEVREKLTAPFEKGGVGMTAIQADMLLKSVEDRMRELHALKVAAKPLAQSIPELKVASPIASAPSVSVGVQKVQVVQQQGRPLTEEEKKALAAQKAAEEASKKAAMAPASASLPPNMIIQEIDGVPTLVEVDKVLDTKADKSSFDALKVQDRQRAALAAEQRARQQASIPPPPSMPVPKGAEPVRVQIRDIYGSVPSVPLPPGIKKPKRKLVDEVEDFRLLTLLDFRRLSSDPGEAIKKLYLKLQALEKQSYSKRMAAIDAWKENEVNQLYIAMGQEQLTKGLPMAQVITQRTAAQQPTLSEEEFDVILDFNEMIQF